MRVFRLLVSLCIFVPFALDTRWSSRWVAVPLFVGGVGSVVLALRDRYERDAYQSTSLAHPGGD